MVDGLKVEVTFKNVEVKTSNEKSHNRILESITYFNRPLVMKPLHLIF